jgi:PAS domain S-box-containing protein
MNCILYVDDDPDLLEIGRLFLESEGKFAVRTSLSASTALELLKSERYDAIVSDYQMPGMDGITFLKALRAGDDATPFIIFTGRGREEVVIEALNSGADFYLQKGGDPEPQFAELTHKIFHAISRRRADQAIIKSEQDYRHLIEHANEAIYVVQDGYLKMVNPRSAEMSGYSEQELINQPLTLFVHPEDREMLLDRFRKRINGEEVPSRYQYRLSCKDGTIRWVELSVTTFIWDGHPATLNFLTDITKRKLAEDALRESEERYRQFFKTTLDSVFITTPDGQWIDFNEALVEVFGCTSREEVFGAPVSSFYVRPEDRATFITLVNRDGQVKEYPLQFRKRDGQVFDGLITSVTLRNPDGSLRAFIGTVRDITDHKRTEDALRESEERYRQFFRTSLDSMFITTPDGRYIDFNDAAMKQVGATSREEMLGTNVASAYVHPEEREVFLERVRQDGYVREHPIQFRRLNGEVFDALISIVPLKNPDGSVKAFVGTVRDISERKRAEQELSEANKKIRLLSGR